MAGTRTTCEPRSTAYYYADLERLKRKNSAPPAQNPDELSEYVESNEVINDGPIKEVPPLRDRQWSLPEYNTPENSRKSENADNRKGETYSTAGTFPMPEPKEKEPLLAELEVVGRLPLTQLESGVRRSRSWYLCCPNMGEEEVSRESSWRYSSLRPVTAPPVPGQNGINGILPPLPGPPHSESDQLSVVRGERDALARALSAERQRSASAARAHDARLAELHGVIAELVRRRAAGPHAAAIPEEELTESCESSTQPAGESTAQGDSGGCAVEESVSVGQAQCDVTPQLSDGQVGTHRCSQSEDTTCSEHSDTRVYPPTSVDICEPREAKIAARVKLKRTARHSEPTPQSWCSEAAEQLALDVCDVTEAALDDDHECSLSSRLQVSRVQCSRLQADCAVLRTALARAADSAHRLAQACAVQESCAVSLCLALAAADACVEVYDVLLALAESKTSEEVSCARAVACEVVGRLEGARDVTQPLLSPGPWLAHNTPGAVPAWSAAVEGRLRAHAARLKAECVRLRPRTPPHMFSYHEEEAADIPAGTGTFNMADMEAAVTMQEVLLAREARVKKQAAAHKHKHAGRSRRHWLEAGAETDL